MNEPTPCEKLQWDSDFFGLAVARVRGNRLDEAGISRVLSWCEKERIDCLYFLADPGHPLTSRLAEDNGFHLVDIRVTFGRKIRGETIEYPAAVRRFRQADEARLRDIARASHHDSRFYFDTLFPHQKCDLLYETWIANSCHGWADAVFTAEHDGDPAGYVTCHISADGVGSIGLIAVDAAARGAKLGSCLVQAALAYFHERGSHHALVTTQGRNLPSQRLYQRAGFLLEGVALWYHRWSPFP